MYDSFFPELYVIQSLSSEDERANARMPSTIISESFARISIFLFPDDAALNVWTNILVSASSWEHGDIESKSSFLLVDKHNLYLIKV